MHALAALEADYDGENHVQQPRRGHDNAKRRLELENSIAAGGKGRCEYKRRAQCEETEKKDDRSHPPSRSWKTTDQHHAQSRHGTRQEADDPKLNQETSAAIEIRRADIDEHSLDDERRHLCQQCADIASHAQPRNMLGARARPKVVSHCPQPVIGFKPPDELHHEAWLERPEAAPHDIADKGAQTPRWSVPHGRCGVELICAVFWVLADFLLAAFLE